MQNKPTKQFKSGQLQLNIWENEFEKEGQKFTVKTASLDKNYKDKNGDWKKSNSLQLNDLPRAILLLQKAYEHLALKNVEQQIPTIPEENVI